MKGFAAAQARHDHSAHYGPADSFSWQDDAPAAYEWAARELFEEQMGETCDAVTGYMEPAETALWTWLARMLKTPECFVPNAESVGAEVWGLILNWRAEIMARLDRDEIEARCERNARDEE